MWTKDLTSSCLGGSKVMVANMLFFLPFRASMGGLDSGHSISTYFEGVCQFKGTEQSFSTGRELSSVMYFSAHIGKPTR